MSEGKPSPSSGSATPGPWRVEDRCIEGPDGNIALLNLVRKDGVTAANGRLIAAAPDLQEALLDLCDAIPEETLAADPPLRAWEQRAREVLRKAEGHV